MYNIKVRKILVFLLPLVMFLSSAISPQLVLAGQCASNYIEGMGVVLPKYSDGMTHTIKADLLRYAGDEKYVLKVINSKIGGGFDVEARTSGFTLGQDGTYSGGSLIVKGNTVTWTISSKEALSDRIGLGDKYSSQHIVALYKAGFIDTRVCDLGTYNSSDIVDNQNTSTSCQLEVFQKRGGEQCGANGCMENGGTTTYVEAKKMGANDSYSGPVRFIFGGPGGVIPDSVVTANNGNASANFPAKGIGTYSVVVKSIGSSKAPASIVLCPKITFQAQQTCGDLCSPVGNMYSTPQGNQYAYELCAQVIEKDTNACLDCVGNDAEHIWTAIGCIPTAPQGIIQTLVQLGLSIGGGVTLLLILAGAFRLSVSAGDPKQAEEAKEQITSAVIGLLFIIFSITILRFIGVQFLQIPGFGG